MMEEENKMQKPIETQDEIDLLEIAGIIWKRKKLIILITITITILALVYSLVATPFYKATAKIIPISSQKSIIPAELIGIAGMLGVGGGTAGGSEIIRAVLGSRELAKLVIKKQDLKRFIYPKVWDEKTGELKANSEKIPQEDEIAELFLKNFLKTTENPKEKTIEISVIFPKHSTLSAIVANEVIDSLQTILNQKAYTNAKRNRLFIEEQVNIAKKNLQMAEDEFRDFQEKYNAVAIDKQMEESIKLYAELVGMLSEREVKLGVLKKITTPDNPEAIALEHEIREIKRKLKELEEGQKKAELKGYVLDPTKKIIIPIENVPNLAIEYIRRRRELEIQNETYKVLLTSLEKAKIEEAKEDISFQVIDYAYPPRYRFKPKRKITVAVAFTASLIFGVFLALLLESIDKRRKQL